MGKHYTIRRATPYQICCYSKFVEPFHFSGPRAIGLHPIANAISRARWHVEDEMYCG